ncbi:MAG: molybdenum cofactor guanylyltransferase [Lachnospiraceae bacterium]|jgi:molybdopterin-guanine dinucleotide biosynthesis protein A
MKNLVILAGGKSSRMGMDKVLLKDNGVTFVERIFANALIYFERIIISTDSREHALVIRKLPFMTGRNVEIVTDNYEAIGPMGGIISVFEETDVERFAIIPVDVPGADMRVLTRLYDYCTKKACFLKLQGGKPEPLIGAYNRSALPDLKGAMEAGLLKIRMALPFADTDIIGEGKLADFENLSCSFRNINTPEELEAYRKKEEDD